MNKARIVTAVIVTFSLLLGASARAAEWHVGPFGAAMNKGTQDSLWDLKSVLAGEQKAIQPGDIVWVGMGTYAVAPPTVGGHGRAFLCALCGTPEKPIIVRAKPGERATIDGLLHIGHPDTKCHNVEFWGLEIMTSTPRAAGPLPLPEITRPEGGVYTYDGARCRFINCIVHDNNQGFSFWVEAVDAEIYGCLIYHNGVQGTERGHGHGIYTQNKDGVKRIVDNILWNGYYYGIQAYGSDTAYVYGFHIEGNILFSNGMASSTDGCSQFVVGGGRPSKNIEFLSNVSYMHPTSNRVNGTLNYGHGANESLVCKDNYLVNGRYALVLGCWDKIVGSGNFLFGRALLSMQPLDKVDANRKGDYSWDNNDYFIGTWPWPFELGWSAPPDETLMDFKQWQEKTGLDKNSTAVETPWRSPRGVTVFIRPNHYDPGRANIAVMNWDRVGAVALDLSGVLKQGQPYRIFNVQSLWGDPVAAGVYDGKPVAVPTLLSWLAPQFDAYVVIPTAYGNSR